MNGFCVRRVYALLIIILFLIISIVWCYERSINNKRLISERKIRCKSNLEVIGNALECYLLKYGTIPPYKADVTFHLLLKEKYIETDSVFHCPFDESQSYSYTYIYPVNNLNDNTLICMDREYYHLPKYGIYYKDLKRVVELNDDR